MENRLFNVAPNSLAEFESFDLNNQNNQTTLEFQDQQFVPFSSPRNSNVVSNFAFSEPPIYPLEAALRTCVVPNSNQFANGLNSSSFASSVNYASDDAFGNNVNNSKATLVRAEFLQPFTWISTNSVNISTDDNNPFGSCNFSNELSLSLATSQPPATINVTNVSDQCSEISCPEGYTTPRCLKESTSSSSKELSLSCSSYYRNGKFSHVLSGSRYLQVVQEILTQIASYSMEILERMCFSSGGIKAGVSSVYGMERGMGMALIGPDETRNEDIVFEVHVDPALQRRALQAKKAQLLTLLQVVDDQYSQCLDEIHTVVSAFHAATELDPQMHTRFVLQTISFLYKSLRERISNQIIAMGAHTDRLGGMRDSEEGSHETCYFQKQWTLQQLKKRDHQLWKPQRGLPERSVSVLRAWMFQNFLHPYPKDAEKHLLAVKSGLTRSQVSNWFINARVRVWKPMIEEMYAEMNKRKARQNEEGSSNNHRNNNHMSFSNLRFNVN